MAALVGLAGGTIDTQAAGEEALLLMFLNNLAAGSLPPEGPN